MENIQTINQLLQESKLLTQEGKDSLEKLKACLTYKSLRLIYLSRKQKRLRHLLQELDSFQSTCEATSLSIKHATQQGNLYQALLLCKSAQEQLRTAETAQYSAIKEIKNQAERKEGEIYMKVKEGLRSVCVNFNEHLYENVLLAYTHISKYSEVSTAIQSEFMHSINRLTKEGIEEALPHDISTMTLETLAHILHGTELLEALRLVLRNLTNLLYNQHLMSRWHEEHDSSESPYPVTSSCVFEPQKVEELKEFYETIKLDLLRNRKHIWKQIQHKIAGFIQESNHFELLKVDEVNQALGWINTFIEIGEDFSGTPTSELKSAVQNKSMDFLIKFHQTNVNNLVNLIEAELWSRLPTPEGYKIKEVILSYLNYAGPILQALSDKFEDFDFSFSSLALGNPFEDFQTSESPEPHLSWKSMEGSYKGPVLCPTALNLIKFMGTYLQLALRLTPVSFQVVKSLIQLVEFFIYAVYKTFISEDAKTKLKKVACIKQFQEEPIEVLHDNYLEYQKYSDLANGIARISGTIESYHQEVFGEKSKSLPEKIVAIESSFHLVDAFSCSTEFLKKVLTDSEMRFVEEFLQRTPKMIHQLEDFMWEEAVQQVINLEGMTKQINDLKWNQKSEENNNYVERLIHKIEDLKSRLEALCHESIPHHLQKQVLGRVAQHVVDFLWETYAKINCNQNGREQMKLDLKAFTEGVQELLDKGLEYSVLEEYLDLWKSNPDNIFNWILENTSVPLRLHQALFTSAPSVKSMNKQARKNLQSTIDNHYRDLLSQLTN